MAALHGGLPSAPHTSPSPFYYSFHNYNLYLIQHLLKYKLIHIFRAHLFSGMFFLRIGFIFCGLVGMMLGLRRQPSELDLVN